MRTLKHMKPAHAVMLMISPLALILAGCAPASVNPGVTAEPTNASRPAQMVIYDFAASPAEVTQNQSIFQRAYRALSETPEQEQADQLKTGHDAAKDLSDALVKKFNALGFTSTQYTRGTTAPDGSLIIDGQFMNIDEGNRLRRLVIGFGAGASKLDTQVRVYEINGGNSQQLLDFSTHAESGKMPGAAVTMGVGAAAQGAGTAGAASAGLAGVKTYRSSVGFLADSTADQIVAYVSQYAANQGWISQDQMKKATLSQDQGL